MRGDLESQAAVVLVGSEKILLPFFNANHHFSMDLLLGERARRIHASYIQTIFIYCGRLYKAVVNILRLRWSIHFLLLCGALLPGISPNAVAQQSFLPDAPQPQAQPSQSAPEQNGRWAGYRKHHILWIIPNYRSEENAAKIGPLRPKQKFRLALDDSFDPTAFLVAGIFAGSSMAQNQYPSFGHGAAGFGKYYGGAFADQAIGNMMTEALLPIALHQDPRYFTKQKGGFWKRTGYAIGREAITRGDDGHNHFNSSELFGNAIAGRHFQYILSSRGPLPRKYA